MQSTAVPTQEQILQYLEAGKPKMGYETNFAVKKFLELPVAKQREIWEQIQSGDRNQRTEAASTLINLVVSDLSGMTRFIKDTFYDGEDVLDAWIILPHDIPNKAEYIFIYFMVHLEEIEDGFTIKSIV